MKPTLLSLVVAGASLASVAPSLLPAAPPTPAPSARSSNTFPREPVFAYTNDRITSTARESLSLIVYQDGFVTVSRSGSSDGTDLVVSGNVGVLKARSWSQALLAEGAFTLPDGPTPDPAGGGAATLTVFDPGPHGVAHTFSFGPGDYPRVEGTIAAILLRLNV